MASERASAFQAANLDAGFRKKAHFQRCPSSAEFRSATTSKCKWELRGPGYIYTIASGGS
jgi:hypothetical protein